MYLLTYLKRLIVEHVIAAAVATRAVVEVSSRYVEYLCKSDLSAMATSCPHVLPAGSRVTVRLLSGAVVCDRVLTAAYDAEVYFLGCPAFLLRKYRLPDACATITWMFTEQAHGV